MVEYASSPPLSALLPAAMAPAAALLGSYLSHLPNPPSTMSQSVRPSVRWSIQVALLPPSLFPLPSSSHSLPELLIQSDCAREKNRAGGREGGSHCFGALLILRPH